MSTSTQDSESMHHQRSLQTATESFITAMKSEDHNVQRYKTYVKDVKLILDGHVADLNTHNQSDVAKQVLRTVHDPEYKYLCPAESSTESSDEDFLAAFAHPIPDQIFSEFPEDLLTTEFREYVTSVCENMEQAHLSVAAAMKEMVKLSLVMP